MICRFKVSIETIELFHEGGGVFLLKESLQTLFYLINPAKFRDVGYPDQCKCVAMTLIMRRQQ